MGLSFNTINLFLFVVFPFFRNMDLPPYQKSHKQFSHLVSRNNEILIETKDSFRTRQMHFWNKYLPSINNNSTLGANEVKMDRTLIPSASSISDTQTANEMKQNRVTVRDMENSSSALRCVHCLLVAMSWTMLFLFSLWYTHDDNIIWLHCGVIHRLLMKNWKFDHPVFPPHWFN